VAQAHHRQLTRPPAGVSVQRVAQRPRLVLLHAERDALRPHARGIMANATRLEPDAGPRLPEHLSVHRAHRLQPRVSAFTRATRSASDTVVNRRFSTTRRP